MGFVSVLEGSIDTNDEYFPAFEVGPWRPLRTQSARVAGDKYPAHDMQIRGKATLPSLRQGIRSLPDITDIQQFMDTVPEPVPNKQSFPGGLGYIDESDSEAAVFHPIPTSDEGANMFQAARSQYMRVPDVTSNTEGIDHDSIYQPSPTYEESIIQQRITDGLGLSSSGGKPSQSH